jgi:hypothetical protein
MHYLKIIWKFKLNSLLEYLKIENTTKIVKNKIKEANKKKIIQIPYCMQWKNKTSLYPPIII